MLYLIQADAIGHVKLGFAADADADARLTTLQTGCSSASDADSIHPPEGPAGILFDSIRRMVPCS